MGGLETPPTLVSHVREQPVCCDFCFNHDIPLSEGGFDSTTRIRGFCAATAANKLAATTPQPQPVPDGAEVEGRCSLRHVAASSGAYNRPADALNAPLGTG